MASNRVLNVYLGDQKPEFIDMIIVIGEAEHAKGADGIMTGLGTVSASAVLKQLVRDKYAELQNEEVSDE